MIAIAAKFVICTHPKKEKATTRHKGKTCSLQIIAIDEKLMVEHLKMSLEKQSEEQLHQCYFRLLKHPRTYFFRTSPNGRLIKL